MVQIIDNSRYTAPDSILTIMIEAKLAEIEKMEDGPERQHLRVEIDSLEAELWRRQHAKKQQESHSIAVVHADQGPDYVV